jgi:hypothetical protein
LDHASLRTCFITNAVPIMGESHLQLTWKEPDSACYTPTSVSESLSVNGTTVSSVLRGRLWAETLGRSGAPAGPVCCILLLLYTLLDLHQLLPSALLITRRKDPTGRSSVMCGQAY